MKYNIFEHINALDERITELERELRTTDRVMFSKLACRDLQIVSDAGEPLITISYDEELGGGAIKLFDKTGKVLVLVHTDEDGGSVTVCSTQEIDPNLPDVSAQIFADEQGNGYIAVCDADGDDRAALSVAPSHLGGAGRVTIHGTVDNRERVVIGCNPKTDTGSIKIYDGAWQEAHSLENEPGDLRSTDPPEGNSSDLSRYRHTLELIEEKLQQDETDENQKRFLNVKKDKIRQILTHVAEQAKEQVRETP